MAQAKFSAGERVSVARLGIGGPSGLFRIVGALPREGGPQQYRVRGETETFDRIVDEGRLETALHE